MASVLPDASFRVEKHGFVLPNQNSEGREAAWTHLGPC